MENAAKILSPKVKKTWLWITGVVALLGVGSAFLFAYSVFWPRIGCMQGMMEFTCIIMLSPGIVGLLIGVILIFVGLKRSPTLFRIACVITIIASLYFIPFGIDAIRGYCYRAKAEKYIALDYDELQRLAAENNDRAARDELTIRIAKEKAEIYHKMGYNELRRLCDEKNDQWARDELEQRKTMYNALEYEYREMTDEELRRRDEEDPRSGAGLELERRRKENQ